MSRVTAITLDVHPSGADPVTATTGASAWSNGASNSGWVEVIASAAADLHVAGIALGAVSVSSQFEIDIGTGVLGGESRIHTIRNLIPSSTAETNLHFFMLTVPVGGISTGDRVSLRVRCNGTFGPYTFAVGLLTYSGLSDTDHLTSLQLRTAPESANSVTITPNGTAWAYSSWFQIWAGTTVETCLLAIVASAPTSPIEMEYEIGFGSSGSEVPKTMVRTTSWGTTGGLRFFPLPAPFPVPPNTPVAVRMRKTGTSTSTCSAALLYINNTTLNAVEKTANEAITVADAVVAQLTNDIYVSVFESITVAESVSLRPSVILLQVAEVVSIADASANVPGAITLAVSDRVFVRDYVALSPSQLAVRVFEAIAVTESPLYPNSDGVSGQLGPQPSAPAGTTGLTDYWTTGI